MTLLWDVQAALKTLLDAAVAVPVYDIGELVGEDATAYVTVGSPSTDGDTATATQDRSRLGGNNWRSETGSVECAVETWTGDTDIAAVRAVARPLLDACTVAVLNDRTLGGLLVPPGLAEVTSVRLREGQTDRGALVTASFTVRYTALLTS